MVLPFLLPSPPADWDKERESKVLKRLTKCAEKTVEPMGSEFLACARRLRLGRSLEEDEELQEALRGDAGDDLNMEEDEEESKALLASNPSNWKTQDHYAILGISRLRYKADDEAIKRAYRRKVLKHHPDKKASASGIRGKDDAYFKCLQRAWEVISNPSKRRQWDSCDPTFDDAIPSTKLKGDFFEIYGTIFENEARFSTSQPVPSLGNADSTHADVEGFYNFWYKMESWRSFENMDEEDTEGKGREEKRWLDKKNKAARSKRKKEDNARLIKLTEQTFKLDPRIIKIKEAEKASKLAKIKEKEDAVKAIEDAKIAAVKAVEDAKIAAEQGEKDKIANGKKDREAQKNAMKKAKKEMKRFMSANNNLLPADATPIQLEDQLTKLDQIFTTYEAADIDNFRATLESSVGKGQVKLHQLFLAKLKI